MKTKTRPEIPVPGLSLLHWLFLFLAMALSFVALRLIGNRYIAAPLYTGIQLAALLVWGRGMLQASLRKPKARGVWMGIGLGLVALILSIVLGNIARSITSVSDNPINETLANSNAVGTVLTLLVGLIQLFGEELTTFIPFMAVLQLCSRDGRAGKGGVALAVIASSVLFALLHLPTYGYNLVQVLLVIGVVRCVLTFGFIRSNNLIVPYISHVLYDNIVFLAVILFAALQGFQ